MTFINSVFINAGYVISNASSDRKIYLTYFKIKNIMSIRLICNQLTINIFKHTKYNLIRPCNFYNFKNLHVKTYDKLALGESKEGEELVQRTRLLNPSTIGIDKDDVIKDIRKDVFKNSDPDKFGTGTAAFDDYDREEDDGDKAQEEYETNRPTRSQQLSNKQYSIMIKDHLNNNRLKEAIDILEVRMLKEDRVKPESYIYNLLISGCAKNGYSKKAFQLFNKMKQRGLKISGGTYTSLLNAAANAPWPQDGLNKANYVRQLMQEKGYTLNKLHYNVMIKAFGRCGDIKTAFELADEMKEKNLNIQADTFNFLLQACASDSENGFRYALLTWHKMHQQNVIPDIYSYKTMIRCVRDCSFGDLKAAQDTIEQILKDSIRHESIESGKTHQHLNQLQSNDKYMDDNVPDKISNQESMVVVNSSEIVTDQTPNLLSKTPHLGSLVALGEISKPEDRLLLLGGLSGFLEEMKNSKVTPGIETFTALLEVVPSTTAAEKKIISMIRKIGLKADIDFFNILIKKRSMRFDYDGAKEVLSMIKTAKLQPDIVTYGVLSLGCQSYEAARELLHEMNQKNIRINIQILGAMLRQGCATYNFNYVIEILQITLEEKVKVNEIFLKHLDRFYHQCVTLIAQHHPKSKANNFKQKFNQLKQRLEIWYEEQGISGLKLEDAIKKLNGSPYQQFKEQQPEGFESVKNEKFLRKQKIRKYIKKIKINDLKDDQDKESI